MGFSSILTDFRAFLFTRTTPSPLQAVSVCVGIKNRSSQLLDFFIPSLLQCEHTELIELSVYDCGSDDVPNLKNEIEKLWKGKLIYQSANEDFTRSHSFNAAMRQSTSGLIHLCDADMSFPSHLVKSINRYCTKYSAWFPHVWYRNEDGSGRFYTESTGMMACRREDYVLCGGLDERIKTWGKEDWLFFFEFYKNGLAGMRSNEKDFVHHYHPSLKPENFEPLF